MMLSIGSLPRSAYCRGKAENGIKQQRRAHFQAQPREPEGQKDAGSPFLLLLWGRKEEESGFMEQPIEL